ncbi:type I-C CRISPR-associated protein Cas8c/Csd1 [Halioxenophilus sp. WMMB6]|uniref:type I-C CRISPR-associated protein Cas8c/Csd1 n=1 Tax=Halioxenophilus sp. WMMB6 TaxID=3073815 RepID=UPI00295E66D5|nr:type I-C CRISPR-associated protein Cas8c/Csd1 [Halioxenophilus sp. WMMB6]
MILQALNDYYDRKKADLPQFGFEEKSIPFIIVIDEEGKFVNLEANSELENGKPVVRSLRVPRATGRSGSKSYQVAYCLWDHYGYVLGQPKLAKPDAVPGEKEVADAVKQHQSFVREVTRIAEALPDDVGVQAVKAFLDSPLEIERLKMHDNWAECLKVAGCNLSFRLAGITNLVCQSEQVIEWVRAQPLPEGDVQEGFCLITGQKSEIVRLHDMVAGVNQKPAPLAAINDKAYESFNKDKGFNFPASAQAVFKYATALNHLLRKSAPNKFRIGETSYVCWAEKPHRLETDTPLFLSFGDDDPDGIATAVKALFNTIHTGAYQDDNGKNRFFVLGLAPNSARIVVRYWKVGNIAELAENFARWFADLELIGLEHYGYPTLKKLLRATALQFKDDNVPPNLPGEVVRAILSGGRLPETLIQSVLRRIRAEQGSVSFTRASLIKAYLNRKYRMAAENQKELTVVINKQDTRTGYCLGRLFAVLEKLQQDAQPGINATIRDRYYSSASTTPKAVFGTLMRLSTHHLKKLDKPEWRGAAERRIREVMELISEFPAHLNLEHQGLFAIGYYHQKQDFFTKKVDQEQGENP